MAGGDTNGGDVEWRNKPLFCWAGLSTEHLGTQYLTGWRCQSEARHLSGLPTATGKIPLAHLG